VEFQLYIDHNKGMSQKTGTLSFTASIAAAMILTGCSAYDYVDDNFFTRPPMAGPVAQPFVAPPADTPELQARAIYEREALEPPPAYTHTGWPNLGTVPPAPKMPTPQEIGETKNTLAVDQYMGAQLIDAQADAPPPVTLPKAGTPHNTDGTISTGAELAPITPPLVPQPLPYLSGQVGMQSGDSDMGRGNGATDMPVSQGEASDMQGDHP
jgi:hypothetical protein